MGQSISWPEIRQRRKALGIQSSIHGRQVQLKRGNQRLKLKIRNQASSSAKTAWNRKGTLYLPTDAIASFDGALSSDADARVVTLNIPAAPAIVVK